MVKTKRHRAGRQSTLDEHTRPKARTPAGSATRVLLILSLLLALAPRASAGEIVGQARTVTVTDQAKHAVPELDDVTYAKYTFEFEPPAPVPNHANANERVARAWVLVNVNHDFHEGNTFQRRIDENSVAYRVLYNGMTIEYQTSYFALDNGFGLRDVGDLLIPFVNVFAERGYVDIHYSYDTTGVQVADERERVSIPTGTTFDSIPDTNIWISYQDNVFEVVPEFDYRGAFPRFTHEAPADSPGKVTIANTTFQSLAIEVSATKTLEELGVAYGFGKPGNVPGYTFGSLFSDAVTSVAGALGGVIDKTVDFIFRFIPGGDKMIAIKNVAFEVFGAVFEITFRDPMLALENTAMLAIAYGLLLFIDPQFRHIFTPLAMVAKGIWWVIVFLWRTFVQIAGYLIEKIPG